jgi:methyl-accepting chemotaxis protein
MKFEMKSKIEIMLIITFNLGATFLSFKSTYPEAIKVGICLALWVCSFMIIRKLNKQDKLIKKLIQETQGFLNGLGGTSEQIFSSCYQINETTVEQASAVVETSTASNEISAMIDKNTDTISGVNESIISINQVVELSSKSSIELERNMKKNAEGNEKVIQLMKGTSGMLEELTGLFREVVEKTAVINDIVFQTKLLSFNASVEAARAGEHGKGFSVVAEEIGNLAAMSGDSAGSIQQTLEQTDNKVKKIISDINSESIQLTNELQTQNITGQEIFKEFNKNFDGAIGSIEGIVEKIAEIKVASDEQNKGVKEMRDAIFLVNQSIQRNSLVVGQTTNLADLLTNDVKDFKDLIFDLKSSESLSDELVIETIPWEEKYYIGIDRIDTEHKNLLLKINNLIEAMNNDIRNEMLSCFEDLKIVTIDHFTYEEGYMESIGYEALESHKRVHKNLLDVVVKFGGELEDDNLDKTKFASFLKNWLFTHIMGVDTKYAEGNRDVDVKSKIAA